MRTGSQGLYGVYVDCTYNCTKLGSVQPYKNACILNTKWIWVIRNK